MAVDYLQYYHDLVAGGFKQIIIKNVCIHTLYCTVTDAFAFLINISGLENCNGSV